MFYIADAVMLTGRVCMSHAEPGVHSVGMSNCSHTNTEASAAAVASVLVVCSDAGEAGTPLPLAEVP